jgi:hypothetical protein
MNKNISKIVVIICILFILFLLVRFLFGKNKNTNAGHIVFLGKDETIRHLKWADDGYFQTFGKVDYAVRNIQTIDDYYKIIEQSVDQFSEEQKRHLTECILAADAFLKTKHMSWFDGEKCNAIPWKIGCIKKSDQVNTYEEGLPHTRTDVILLPKTIESSARAPDSVYVTASSYATTSSHPLNQNPGSLTRLLIHEKMHIYQKMYKEDVQIYLTESGFTRYQRNSDNNNNTRSNPDVDHWTYKDKDGEIYKSQYLDGAKSIRDVTYLCGNDQTAEHPFEKMAIEMSHSYM